METKLTLRMDSKLIDSAKSYAERQGISLSKLVAEYFQMIASKRNKNLEAFQPTPILSEITGVLQKNPGNKDSREAYRKHLEEKYL
ncbi:MAG: DUF6364 family protein [bacterium]